MMRARRGFLESPEIGFFCWLASHCAHIVFDHTRAAVYIVGGVKN
jgi:hypothetical protein